MERLERPAWYETTVASGSVEWARAKPYRRWFPLVAVAGSLAIVLLAGEIALRATCGTPPRWVWPQERYRPDPETGLWLRPAQVAFTHGAPVEINSAGIRDAEYAARPPAGTRRVLAIGDSQTFGNGLALPDTWPKRLDAELDARGAGRHEVLNAGVPGTDTWQHEAMLERLLARYRVDEVVLAFYVNDVQAAVEPLRLHPPAEPGARARSLARATYLVKRSALGVVALRAARRVQGWASGAGPSKEEAVLAGAAREDVEVGWAQVRRSLARMQDAARGAGAGFFVVALPRRDQVAGLVEGRAYNERLRAICDELGVPLADMLEPLRAAWPTHGSDLFIAWDGHQSAVANGIIAQVVADRLGAAPGENAALTATGQRSAKTTGMR